MPVPKILSAMFVGAPMPSWLKKGKSKISVLDSLRCSEQVDEWSPYADSLLQLVGPISEVKKSY